MINVVNVYFTLMSSSMTFSQMLRTMTSKKLRLEPIMCH